MFILKSPNKPSGDQPKAIKSLIDGLNQKIKNQVLLGVTGSGKTFTIANVIKKTNRPTIILSHNKTLAAQLYSEFKELFPSNRVEYFVSNFDYYRPEAYLPKNDVYVDKTSKSNWDLESMRMSSMNAALTRRDTIIIASVASIYGLSNPSEYKSTFYEISIGQEIILKNFFFELVKRNYSRNNIDLTPGNFSVKGDVIEIAPGWTNEYYIRIEMFGDEIEAISKVDTLDKNVINSFDKFTIYPADAYTLKPDTIKKAITTIKHELNIRLKFLNDNGKLLEAQRLEVRTKNDLESLEEFGMCSGIENYSRHMDGRNIGDRPFTIIDYMPSDSLMVIDESHMMIPQLNAMYNGDRSRKSTLVDYGFRLPSALDNRPLKFDEWEKSTFQKIYVSATPAQYEIDKSFGMISNQIIRPTWLLDPTVEVVPTMGQVERIHDEIIKLSKKNERSFILTTTIRMAEELTKHLQSKNIKAAYLHSELKTFERIEVLRKLRKGVFDVVVGINLLREGIDIPEVSRIFVLDADKESFFRSTTSLIQIMGRAARNVNGHILLFGDKITKSMHEAIQITTKRRKLQEEYNKKNNTTPQTIIKPIPEPIQGHKTKNAIDHYLKKGNKVSKESKIQVINDLRSQMLSASKDLNFERAAQLRDIILELEGI